MSTRLEYVPATCGVEYIDERGIDGVEDPEARAVLALSYDEVIVIPGMPDELRELAFRIIRAVSGPVAGAPEAGVCDFCKQNVIEWDGEWILADRWEDRQAMCDDTPENYPYHEVGLDLASSASRQHYIDTGEYLRVGEAITV